MARVMAYSSLMWDNALSLYPGEKVVVDGMRRAFVGQSTKLWGSATKPCPQIGLLQGDGCEAVAFDIPRADRGALLRNLKQREGGGQRTTIRVRGENGKMFRAIGFLPPSKAQWSDRAAAIGSLREARGVVGTGTDYIRTLVHAMELWGIEDLWVSEIWGEIRP